MKITYWDLMRPGSGSKYMTTNALNDEEYEPSMKITYWDLMWPGAGRKRKKKNTSNNEKYEPSYLDHVIMEINNGNKILNNFFKYLERQYIFLLNEDIHIYERKHKYYKDNIKSNLDKCNHIKEILKQKNIEILETPHINVTINSTTFCFYIENFREKINAIEDIKREYENCCNNFIKEKEDLNFQIKKLIKKQKIYNLFHIHPKKIRQEIERLQTLLLKKEKEMQKIDFFNNLSEEDILLINNYFEADDEYYHNYDEARKISNEIEQIYERNINEKLPLILKKFINKNDIEKVFNELGQVGVKATLGNYKQGTIQYNKKCPYTSIIKSFLNEIYYNYINHEEKNLENILSKNDDNIKKLK